MSEAIVAKRYADALFQIEQEKGTLEQVETEFRALQEAFQDNSKIISFLENPGIEKERKKQVMKDVLAGLSADARNTLVLLVDRNRGAIIPEVMEQYLIRMNEVKGIAEAVVYSAVPLSEEEKAELENVFAKKLNKNKLILNNITDKSLLGGVKLRIGNTIYDGTISGKLERIERKINSAH